MQIAGGAVRRSNGEVQVEQTSRAVQIEAEWATGSQISDGARRCGRSPAMLRQSPALWAAVQQTITLVAISWDHGGLPLAHLLAILCCTKVTEGRGVWRSGVAQEIAHMTGVVLMSKVTTKVYSGRHNQLSQWYSSSFFLLAMTLAVEHALQLMMDACFSMLIVSFP